MAIEIRNEVTPELKRIAAAIRRPRTLLEAGAKAVQVGITKKLKQLQAKGNVNGWPSQKFFAGGKNSVEKNVGIVDATDDSITIDVADPRFAHHVLGGPVYAKRSEYLTIPLTAEAYAKAGQGTLRESWPELKLITLGQKRFLGIVDSKNVTLHFILKKSVIHSPHPDSLPDAEQLLQDAQKAMVRVGRIILKAER